MALDPIVDYTGPTTPVRTEADQKIWVTNLRAWLARLGGETLAAPAAVGKAIYGLTYANNVSDLTNDIDIAAGGAMDATGLYFMKGSALTKRLDAAWAVGNNQGGLLSGSIGNNDYRIWEIARSDTGVVDYGFELDSNPSPTLPTNYDFKRHIGWFKRVGATIVLFDTYETEGGGIEMNWRVPTVDVNLVATLTTSRRTDAVKVPQTFSTEAHLNVDINDASPVAVWVYCPDQTDAAPTTTAVAPLYNAGNPNTPALVGSQMRIRTSATGTIAARATVATVDLYAVSTMGFLWSRR